MPDTEAPFPSKRLTLPTIVLAILLGGVCWAAIEWRGSENVKGLFGGAEGLQVVLAPAKVEAYRVALRKGVDDDAAETIAGATIVSGPVAVDENTARELAEILKSPNTYGWDFAKGCKFDPGVVIRFASQSSAVDVVFCFHCEELQIYRDGKRVGGEDFDAASNRLAAIMKRVFPDDEEIQKL